MTKFLCNEREDAQERGKIGGTTLKMRHEMLWDFNLESEDSRTLLVLSVSCSNNDAVSSSVK